jgi:hypothetical protein
MGALLAAIITTIYDGIKWLILSLFSMLWWLLETVWFWVLETALNNLSYVVEQLGWMPQVQFTTTITSYLEYAETYFPLSEISLLIPGYLAFEGALVVWRVTRLFLVGG